MIRFVIIILIILVILFILRSKPSKIANLSKKNYRLLIFSILILGLLILIATSGRFILPQIFQLLKMGFPLISKFIGF